MSPHLAPTEHQTSWPVRFRDAHTRAQEALAPAGRDEPAMLMRQASFVGGDQ